MKEKLGRYCQMAQDFLWARLCYQDMLLRQWLQCLKNQNCDQCRVMKNQNHLALSPNQQFQSSSKKLKSLTQTRGPASVLLNVPLGFCLQCSDAVGWATGRASGSKKTEQWGAGMVICLEQGADLHMAQLMPLPVTFSCFSKIQIDFTFLVPAHLGSPGQRAVKRVCVV